MIEIYLCTNRITGKVYVGQTCRSVRKRWREHVTSALAHSKYECRVLACAIRKYGADAFDVTVLQAVSTVEEANIAEVEWIDELNCRAPNGYNITPGGVGNRNWTEEQKLARSQLMKKLWEERRDVYLSGVRRSAAEVPIEKRREMQRKAIEVRVARVGRKPAKQKVEERWSGDGMRRWWATLTPEARKAKATAGTKNLLESNTRRANEAKARGPIKRKQYDPSNVQYRSSQVWSPERRAKHAEAVRLGWAKKTDEERAEIARKREAAKPMAVKREAGFKAAKTRESNRATGDET